jgi:hypothetical protein
MAPKTNTIAHVKQLENLIALCAHHATKGSGVMKTKAKVAMHMLHRLPPMLPMRLVAAVAAAIAAAHLPAWWAIVDDLADHLEWLMNLPEKERGMYVFSHLASCYTWDRDKETGKRVGNKEEGWFNYKVNGKEVCQPVFRSWAGVSRASLNRWEAKIRDHGGEIRSPYGDKTVKELGSESRCYMPCIMLNCYGLWGVRCKGVMMIAWFLSYASTVGDYLPDLQVTVTPRRTFEDLHQEYLRGE